MKILRNPKWILVLGCLAACTLVGIAMAAGVRQGSMPSASSVVHAQTYVSLDPVPRGKEFEGAVVMEISKGFHMNSHTPSEDYLIPTAVTPEMPPGVKLLGATYPAGEAKKFSFSDKPLDVYTGTVTVRMKFSVQSSAPLGAMSIPATLRYQACNDTSCLAPVKVPVVLRIEVGAAGAETQRLHGEIFTAEAPKKN